MTELGKIIIDRCASVQILRKFIDNLGKCHNTWGNFDDSSLLEVTNSFFELICELVGTLHASLELSEVILMDHTVHDTSNYADNITASEGISLNS